MKQVSYPLLVTRSLLISSPIQYPSFFFFFFAACSLTRMCYTFSIQEVYHTVSLSLPFLCPFSFISLIFNIYCTASLKLLQWSGGELNRFNKRKVLFSLELEIQFLFTYISYFRVYYGEMDRRHDSRAG